MSAEFQLLFSYASTFIMPPEVIGELPDGLRVNFHFSGGEINGIRIHGDILPVGTNSMLLRRDGVGVVDVRSTIRTSDGALVYMTHTGLLDFGIRGYDDFINGNLPSHLPVRSGPRFQTSHPDYLWLNRLQAFAVGVVQPGLVTYEVYSVEAQTDHDGWSRFDEEERLRRIADGRAATPSALLHSAIAAPDDALEVPLQIVANRRSVPRANPRRQALQAAIAQSGNSQPH